MAIVVQSDRFPLGEPKETLTIGPGSYEKQSQFNQKKNFNPFNSSSKRFRNNKKRVPEHISPGPGAYDIVKDPFQEKVLISATGDLGLKIIEVPKLNGIFKSQINRFDKKYDNDYPGPGSYQNKQSQMQKKKRSQTLNMANEIKQNINYQFVPSVPSKQGVYGYTEQQNYQLTLNKPTVQQHSGLRQDQVGPGHYDQADVFQQNKQKKRGTSWAKYKQKKLTKARPIQTPEQIGPGKYDPKFEICNTYKDHTQHNFLSKTMRHFDGKKGAIANKFIIEKVKIQAKNLMSNEEPFDEQQFEFIEENNPGPGYYHNENLVSSIKVTQKPEKLQFFGCSAIRFQESIQKTVGPGDYDPNNNQDRICHSQAQTGFNSTQNRELYGNYEKKPGPGQYNPKVNLEDRLTDKVKSGLQGQFGSTVTKGVKLVENVENPGPGYYLNPDIIAYQNYQDVIVGRKSHFFQSQIDRDLWKQQGQGLAPDCCSYQVKNFNISKEKQQNENYTKKAPFMTKQNRFKYEQKSTVDEDENIYQEDERKSRTSNDFFKTGNQGNSAFNSKDSRFQYKQQNKLKNKVGPGQYSIDTNQPWNKKTFNILYAEI